MARETVQASGNSPLELQPIVYEVGGKSFTGYFADGSGGAAAPGVLVAHEGGGLLDHPKERALRLAKLGYVAFALDLYGEIASSPQHMRALVDGLLGDLPTFRARVNAAFSLLKGHPHVDAARTAAIGFCFGGAAVLELARSGADVGCVVGFHAALITTAPEDARRIKGKVLVCLGAEGPLIGDTHREPFREEMTQAGVDWQMHLYGGVGHSFTNRAIDTLNVPGFRYDEAADRRSWAAMLGLFEEVFGRGRGADVPKEENVR